MMKFAGVVLGGLIYIFSSAALAVDFQLEKIAELQSADGANQINATTYTFDTFPGSFFSVTGNLDANFLTDLDTFIITVTQPTTINIFLQDTGTTGDPICVATSAITKACATSPDFVNLMLPIRPGTYTFFVAYPQGAKVPSTYDIIVEGF